MQGSLDQPPIIVRGSRGRAIRLIVISAIFVAIGSGLLRHPESATSGLVSTGIFALFGVIGLGMFIAPPRLEIGPSGLTQTVLWRTRRFAWTDIYNFRPAVLGLANKAVGFDYLGERPKRSGLRALNAALVG